AKLDPKPDLIIWPETMFPGYALNPDYSAKIVAIASDRREDPLNYSVVVYAFVRAIEELQGACGIPMLVGAQSLEGFRITGTGEDTRFDYDRRFNSVFLIENKEVRAERYDKIELTPFGEVIPYVWRWKSVQKLIESVAAGGMKFDLDWGRLPKSFVLQLT